MPLQETFVFRFRAWGFHSFVLVSFFGLFSYALYVVSRILFAGEQAAMLYIALCLLLVVLIGGGFLVFGRMPWQVTFDKSSELLVVEPFIGSKDTYPLDMLKEWKERPNQYGEVGIVLYFINGNYVAIPGFLLDSRIGQIMQELALPMTGEEKRTFMGFKGSIIQPK